MKTSIIDYKSFTKNKFVFLLVTLITLSFVVTACGDDDYNDGRVPIIKISGITEGDTLRIAMSDEVHDLNAIFSDDGGLSNFTVAIDSSGTNINTYSSELKYKLEHEAISLPELSGNFYYDTHVTVADRSGHTTTLNFKLQFTDYLAFDYLGLVGDATAAGWNPVDSAVMTQSTADPAIFTYTGPLTPGELKIHTVSGDWCDGQWLNAALPNQPVSDTGYIITTGCDGPDNKWRIEAGTAGTYLITINLAMGTIIFELQ